MKTKFFQTISLAALAAFALVGCGGSGSSAVPAVGNLRQQVLAAVEGGFGAQSTGSSQNSSARSVSSSLTPIQRNSDVPTFNQEYELWSVYSFDGTLSRINYFLDQAISQPAGFQQKSANVETDGTVRTEASLEITAGKFAGLSHTITATYAAPVFTYTFAGTEPDGSRQNGTGTFTDGVGEYNTVEVDAQGVSRSYRATYAADGSSRVTYDSPSLFQYTLEFRSDRSGTGTVTGDNLLLPATLTWDAEGNGTITFADTVTVNFTGFDFNQI